MLEKQLQRELNLPRRRSSNGTRDFSKVAVTQCPVGIRKCRRIRDVITLRSKLDLRPFRDTKVLEQ